MARRGTGEPGTTLPDPSGAQGGKGSQGGGGNVAGGVLAAPTGQGVAGDVVRAATRPDAGAPAEPAALTTKAAAKWGSLSAVWATLMADRAELHPGSRGLVLTTKGKAPRSTALRSLLRALDQGGYGLDELRAALRWVYTSGHYRAQSARQAQDPVMALLRHGVDYVELARDGAQAPPAKPGARPQAINGYPSAPAFAAHIKSLFGCHGERPKQLHSDPIVNAAGHAAIDACGGWQPLGRLNSYEASRAYEGPFASAYLDHLQTHGHH